jgi:transcriptional regulator with XRE-family HTH domain
VAEDKRERNLDPQEAAGLAMRVRELIGENFDEAARRTGLSAAPLNKLANGQTVQPTLKVVSSIARTYGKSIDWLLWGDVVAEQGTERHLSEHPHSRPEQLYRHMMHPATVQAFGGRVTHHDRHAAMLAVARDEGYTSEELAELHELIATALRHQEGA